MFFLNSWILELIILLITCGFCHYIYFHTVKAKYWAKKNVPHLPAKYYGNALSMGTTKTMQDFYEELYKVHKSKRILGFWSIHWPVLTVFDRDIIKNILIRDFSYFHDRVTMDVGEHDPLIYGNLFNLNGHAWRNMRVKLTPTFTSGKMKMMFPTIMKCGEELSDYLEKIAASDKAFDCKDISSRFTMNVIGSCAFGIEVNALENPDSDFVFWGKKIFNPRFIDIVTNIFIVVFPAIGKLLKISQLPRGTTEFFLKTVEDTISYRKKNNIARKDFMQLLIELVEKGKIQDVDKDDRIEAKSDSEELDTEVTIKEAAAQAFLFFAAGHETSATTMTLALYELGRHPEVQQTLKKEIKMAAEKDGGQISYETIIKLDYLEWVIQETLRKYPVVPVLFRETARDYYMPEMDVTIDKKTLVIIPNYCLVHDPEYFPEPSKFDPMRFSPERKDEIPPYCHIPFGEGPRNCIGNRFGLLQAKVGLSSILAKYSVVHTDKTPKELKFVPKTLTLTFAEDLCLKLVLDQP